MKNARRIAVCMTLLTAVALLAACGSMPMLEEPECTASRGVVKELYSYHFGNDMAFSPETLAPKKKFLTPELAASLAGSAPGADVFTTGDTDFPKAFRVGGCKREAADKCDVQVLLFWRTDTRTEQRELHVEVVKQGDKWLVNKIQR